MSAQGEPSEPAPSSTFDRNKIVQALVWPGLVLILALLFYTSISGSIGRPGTTVEFGAAGVRIIAEQVDKASESRAGGVAVAPGAEARAEKAAQQAEQVFSKLLGRTILWVDDHPENNVFLQNAFAEAGVRVFNAYSNQHARELLAQRGFDLAITDVGRDQEGAEAGLELHPLLQNSKIPVIVYSGSWSGANRGKEHEHQVLQITNDPSVVLSVAVAALARTKE